MLSQQQSKAVSLKPFLNHYGETSVEQIEKNRDAISLLEGWLSEEVPSTELLERQSYLAELKQTIDSQRLPGSQFYLFTGKSKYSLNSASNHSHSASLLL